MNTIKKIAFCMLAGALALGVSTGCDKSETDVLVSEITLNTMSQRMVVGESFQLIDSVVPADASTKELVWTSNNRAVATVDENGLVQALAPGEARISATAVDAGGYRITCVVTVYPPFVAATGVQFYYIDQQNVRHDIDATQGISLAKGASFNLRAEPIPANATDKYIAWSIGDARVATVTFGGTVQGMAAGTTQVYAQARNRDDGTGVSDPQRGVCKVQVTAE